MSSSKGKFDHMRFMRNSLYNQSSLSLWHRQHEDGDNPSPVTLVIMPPYPTRFLTRRDQLLLAVNNISFQEVKDSQAPISGWEKEKGGLMDGWRGTSFVALFSLNEGDPDALKAVLESSKLLADRGLSIPFWAGSEDEQGDVVSPEEIDGQRVPTLTMTMPRGNSKGMTLRFAYRDYDEEFGNYPEVVIDMTLDSGRPNDTPARYTQNMTWNYCVILNSAKGRIPSDSASRKRYDATKALLRSMLAAMGVTPSGMRV